jgi:hypothetical protein
MTAYYHTQANFSRGQLDPRLHVRTDFDGYYKGARTLQNVLIQAQGAIKKRFGTRFLYNLSLQGITQRTQARFEIFQFYDTFVLLVFLPSKILVVDSSGIIRSEFETPYTATYIQELDTAQTFNTMIITHGSVSPKLLRPEQFPTVWSLSDFVFKNQPTYDFIDNYRSATFTIEAQGQDAVLIIGTPVLVICSADVFLTQHVGGLLFAGGGTVRLQTLQSATQMQGVLLNTIDTGTGTITASIQIAGADVLLTEPIFSDIRGWPRTVSFFQSRLVFGGCDALPTLITMSSTNQFTDFDDSETDPTNAISVLINSDKINEIKKIVSTTTLIIFTDTSNFVLQLGDGGAVTPENAAFIAQGTNGINDIKPAILDGQVFYVEKGGNIVRSYTVNGASLDYSDIDISVLSQNVINAPLFMTVYRSQAINDGEYLFIANSDGTLAIFQSNQNQEMAAWTTAATDGLFGAMAQYNGILFFAVEREGQIYLEILDNTIYTDSSTHVQYDEPHDYVESLEHLDGKLVRIVADGFVQTPKTVVNGKIILDTAATDVTVGLFYQPIIIPMYVAINTQIGNTLYTKTHIQRIYIDFFESLGIKVNGQLLPFLNLNTTLLDTPPTPKSGMDEIAGRFGWDPRTPIIITQDEPLPMTILAITYKVEI